MRNFAFSYLPSILLLVLLGIGQIAFAAPTLTFIEKATASDGKVYRHYQVVCQDNRKKVLTSWKRGRKWCVGEHSAENCSATPMKTRARSCRSEDTDNDKLALNN